MQIGRPIWSSQHQEIYYVQQESRIDFGHFEATYITVHDLNYGEMSRMSAKAWRLGSPYGSGE